MSYFSGVTLRGYAAAVSDAFGRGRVSTPTTIFDSKQVNDNQPLLWDDAETSGSGTSSSWSQDLAATTISVSNLTAGTRVRQTFQKFNYQPGKSQLIFMTGVIGTTTTGITSRMGYYDTNNGLFLSSEEGTVKLVRRTYVSGSPVDNAVAQSSWDDPMDGSGPSGITLDFSKTQILLIDFEWLGVGSVRFGFVVDGAIYIAHTMKHANTLTNVYMSTPNLPLRYEIINDGNGAAFSLQTICSTVITEGGADPIGILRRHSNGTTAINANTAGTAYALLGLKLQSAKVQTTIEILSVTVLSTTADDFEWFLVYNPTLASALSYSNLTNSSMQVAVGEGSNPSLSTVTGGTITSGGYATSHTATSESIRNQLRLGIDLSGNLDEVVLAVRPFSINADIAGCITWREL